MWSGVAGIVLPLVGSKFNQALSLLLISADVLILQQGQNEYLVEIIHVRFSWCFLSLETILEEDRGLEK